MSQPKGDRCAAIMYEALGGDGPKRRPYQCLRGWQNFKMGLEHLAQKIDELEVGEHDLNLQVQGGNANSAKISH